MKKIKIILYTKHNNFKYKAIYTVSGFSLGYFYTITIQIISIYSLYKVFS